MSRRLENLVVVLYEPQDDINIGSVLRVVENFEVGELRLVNPASADPERILISAPRTQHAISQMKVCTSLEEAVGDTKIVFGTSARPRRAHMSLAKPWDVAGTFVGAQEKVALVFGREDSGLPNEALDRCDVLMTIPTNPSYSSLNLAQAVLLCVWECFRAAEVGDTEPTLRTIESIERVERGQLERMLGFAEQALNSVEFFKSENGPQVMRSVRNVFSRAGLDERELAIWFGIWKEIPAYLKRKGLDQGPDS